MKEDEKCKCKDKSEKTCECDDKLENSCDCKENVDVDKLSHSETVYDDIIEGETNFLKDFQRVQAEFDNYRKRMQTALAEARQDGFIDAIEGFLPAMDSFKMASDMITDKNTLAGIKFIEKGILDTLQKMGVEVIDTQGKFNPALHHAIDSEDLEGYESGDIVRECYKGFTYKGRVIRYSQVVVKK